MKKRTQVALFLLLNHYFLLNLSRKSRDKILKNLKKESNKVGSVLTITHATVLKVFLVKFLKFPLKKADSTYFKNTSISFFEIKNKNIKAKTINDSTHLDNDTLKSKRIYRR